MAGVNQNYEMARLSSDGLPATGPEVIDIFQVTGSETWLRIRSSTEDQTFQRDSALPAQSSVRVMNAASFKEGSVAPGSLVSIFGIALDTPGASATRLPLPATLAGVSVTLGGRSCPLLFVGSEQINAQVPVEATLGTSPVSITQSGRVVGSGTLAVAGTAPGIFVFGANRAVASNQDYSVNSASNPARVGSYITIYHTGQGAFLPVVRTGDAAPTHPWRIRPRKQPRQSVVGKLL